MPDLTTPEARFFLLCGKSAPIVERRIYLSEIESLDPHGDYWISLAVPGSPYYDLRAGTFFPFFAQIKDELNLMTVSDLQEKARALRMKRPELFRSAGPIVKKRFGSGGEHKTAVIADVLGFSTLVAAHPHRFTHTHFEDPQDPEFDDIEVMGTSESHNALVMLFWDLHRELFVADEAHGSPTYSHVASDSMLLIYDDLPRAIDAAARVLRWSLRHSQYSLRIGVGCGTFSTIQAPRLQREPLLESTTVALFFGTALLNAYRAEKKQGKNRGPCIVLSDTCEHEHPREFRELTKSGLVIRSKRDGREDGHEVNYLATVDPGEYKSLREGLERQRAAAVDRCPEQRRRYDQALADFLEYQAHADSQAE